MPSPEGSTSADSPPASAAPCGPAPAASSDAPCDQDIECPLCEYNLRGLVEPRCPECGYRFNWEELLNVAYQRHPFLFEHHPRHNTWSFWRTFWAGRRPRRFWRAVYPTQPSRVRRLILYWLLCVVPLLLAGVGTLVAAGPSSRWLGGTRSQLQAYLNSPQGASMRQSVVAQFGSVTAYLNFCYPRPWTWAYYRAAMRESGTLWLLLVPLLWPWLSFLALLVFQQSIRSARIRRSHVLRCVLYSSDGLIVFGLAGLALGFTFNLFPALWVYLYDQTWFTAIVDPHGRDSQELLLAWLILIWAATFAWRLRTAYRYYLRFEDPLATVLASQVIVLLAAAIAFVNRWV